ncbi:hypothetical protein A2U01_0058829, partial [Trifolium medium]|nr:hypothetical protein [Trifolium medium]
TMARCTSSARKGVLVLVEAHCAREYRALRSVGKL